MKKLLYILLGAMVACLATCCHRVSDTEARLIAIDSLVCDQPDSALSLLADINGDSLRGEARAYHALLTVQALYKAYIPATSDTLIRRAWDYYRDHGSYDRRIRAMLYSGTVAEELGRPDSAMRWYKRTELESRPDDHYHRGYALEKMALLYQGVYETKHAIAKYRLALPEFETINDTSNIMYCTFSLSKMYPKYNNDSALYYGNKLKSQAITFKRAEYNAYYTGAIGKYLFYDGKYNQAKDSLLKLIISGNEIPNNSYLLLAISYEELNKSDSAQLYFKMAKNPLTNSDSILYYQLLSRQSYHNNEIERSIEFEQHSNNLAADEIVRSKNNMLLQIENTEEKNTIELVERQQVLIILILIILLIFTLSFLYLRNIKQRKRYKHEIAELQAFTKRLQSLNNELGAKYSEISRQQEEALSELADIKNGKNNDIILQGTNSSIEEMVAYLTDSYRFILTQIRKNIGKKENDKKKLDGIIKKALTPTYFSYLQQYVDYAYNGLSTSMKTSGKLTEKEINVICMYLCRLPNTVVRVYTGYSSNQNTIRYRNTITKKYFGSKEALDNLIRENHF